MPFHINRRGDVAFCEATRKCPFGDFLTDHFDTAKEASMAYELAMETKMPNVYAGVKKAHGKAEISETRYREASDKATQAHKDFKSWERSLKLRERFSTETSAQRNAMVSKLAEMDSFAAAAKEEWDHAQKDAAAVKAKAAEDASENGVKFERLPEYIEEIRLAGQKAKEAYYHGNAHTGHGKTNTGHYDSRSSHQSF